MKGVHTASHYRAGWGGAEQHKPTAGMTSYKCHIELWVAQLHPMTRPLGTTRTDKPPRPEVSSGGRQSH